MTAKGLSFLAAGRVKSEDGVLKSWEESIAGLSVSKAGAKLRVAERRKVGRVDVLRLALAVIILAVAARMLLGLTYRPDDIFTVTIL